MAQSQLGATETTPVFVEVTRDKASAPSADSASAAKPQDVSMLVVVALIGALAAQLLSHRFTKARDRRKERTDAFDRLILAMLAARRRLDELAASDTPEYAGCLTRLQAQMAEIEAARASYRARFGVNDRVLSTLESGLLVIEEAVDGLEALPTDPKATDGKFAKARLLAREEAERYGFEMDRMTSEATLTLMSRRDQYIAKRAAKQDRKRFEKFVKDLAKNDTV